ncbi:MAG: hypothetical protein JNL22_06215 [Bacteroidales bacterium]|mgnify:CR=1 FL=1|jgi:hypothetical protein|nr:hypothetical protein [Bacteroidales bacterium]
MKTQILAAVAALFMLLSLSASAEGNKTAPKPNVKIFRNNSESVDVYVAKPAGELLKIVIYSESGTRMMTTRVKKQSTRYIRYYLNELPKGNYKVSVLKDNESIADFNLSL